MAYKFYCTRIYLYIYIYIPVYTLHKLKIGNIKKNIKNQIKQKSEPKIQCIN